MAIPKTSLHNRSASLPSTSHPLDANIESHLRGLKASQATPSSSSSLCQSLCSVKDLHEQMNDLIRLPHNEQILSHKHYRVEVEEVLDGSLALLDASSSALDALSQMNQSILDLKSALRRGTVDVGVHSYVISRKKVNKVLSKCLLTLKKSEKSRALAQSENACAIIRTLKETETICLTTLKSLLPFIMGKKISQTRGWSLVAKLVKSKTVSTDADNLSEVEYIDHALCALSDKYSAAETKDVMNKLDTLETIVQELENSMQSVSRCFIKTRVSLLNLLNQ
ncbi:uncharacterized protein LOC110699083 [Chenopodium quinoa]|uniref:Uncharacterized protein n=1 Tax=Chenopodium quinoa TaxID=63459 RepID=A0A803MXG4_CHEQI|nr:uncharacterized protein LOC110699083 [Chenopodium quinoa]